MVDQRSSSFTPTGVRFAARWHQRCWRWRSTPDSALDVVLVNVDNPRWLDLTDRYDVNGISQLNLFNCRWRSPWTLHSACRKPKELNALASSLLDDPLPVLASSTSAIGSRRTSATPRDGNASVANAGPMRPWISRHDLPLVTLTAPMDSLRGRSDRRHAEPSAMRLRRHASGLQRRIRRRRPGQLAG